ncbi:MAG: pyrroline-5-carboxylate reductase, partial [Aestuariivirgaceae bacterium]
MKLDGKLVLLGAGKMGGAMLQGWLESGLPGSQIVILDPAPPPETMALIDKHAISHNPDIGDITNVEVVLA